MLDFIAIDFETANSKRSSACSIGLIYVENGEIVDREYYTIKPTPNYYERHLTAIHGMTDQDTNSSPCFGELWNTKLRDKLSGKILVAHNAAFDMSVLRAALDEFNIEFPNITYYCTYKLARNFYPSLINHKLPTVAEKVGHKFNNHHNALADSEACATVMIHFLKSLNCTTLYDLEKNLHIRSGELIPQDNTYSQCRRDSRDTFDISQTYVSDNLEIQKDNPFRGKTVVFTGSVPGMTRDEASAIVQFYGGNTATTVTKKTDFVIVETLDDKAFLTSKLKKALEIIDSGGTIELITCNDFVELLRPPRLKFTIKVSMIETNCDFFLNRNLYNDFYNATVMFSEDINNRHYWQMIGDCGGRCYWLEEDMQNVTHFVISTKEYNDLKKDKKSQSIMMLEQAWCESSKGSNIRKCIVINENTFHRYLQNRIAHQERRAVMEILVHKVSEEYRENTPIEINEEYIVD